MTTGQRTYSLTEKMERNKKLYEDFTSGKYNVIQLVAKYQINSARIYQIVRTMEKKGQV